MTAFDPFGTGHLGQASAQLQHYANYLQQQGGFYNGLFGQSAQAVSGHSNQAQSGTCGKCGAAYATSSGHGGYCPGCYGRLVQQFNAQALSGGTASAVPDSVKPLPIEGIKLGELIAVRGWKVTPQCFLRSMSADCVWAPHEPMEGKTKSKEEHCGVYAYKRASDFLRQHETSGLDVYGKVALWGDIIEHELGYRAEWAKIIEIDGALSDNGKYRLADVREKYCAA